MITVGSVRVDRLEAEVERFLGAAAPTSALTEGVKLRGEHTFGCVSLVTRGTESSRKLSVPGCHGLAAPV